MAVGVVNYLSGWEYVFVQRRFVYRFGLVFVIQNLKKEIICF